MSYDIRITRRTPWWGDEEPQITAAQWAAAVEADTELEMIHEADGGDDPQHWATQSAYGRGRAPPVTNSPFPWSNDLPFIADSAPCAVYGPLYSSVLGEGLTPKEAAALVVTNLSPDCGPQPSPTAALS